MTQDIDEQLRRAFDSLAERLRSSIADQVSLTVEHVAAAVEVQRQATAAAAGREAAEQAERTVTARLNGAFALREEQVKEAARAEWFEAGFQQARAEALVVQEARAAEAEAEVAAAARAAAEAAATATAAATAAATATAAASVDMARHRESLESLLRAVRGLDAATSLSQTLDALAAAAKADADHVAVFLLRGDVLRAWSHAGFEAGEGAASFEVPLDQAGVAADAVRSGAPQHVNGDAAGRPAFAGGASKGAFVAVPLSMNGQVIAVVCGERVTATDEGLWLASVYEILARHAARVLESLTALRLAQMGSQPPAMAPASRAQ